MVMVIEENYSYSQIIDSPEAPYINRLAAQGAVFTQFFGVTHPSQPNYLALFSNWRKASRPSQASVRRLPPAIHTWQYTHTGS